MIIALSPLQTSALKKLFLFFCLSLLFLPTAPVQAATHPQAVFQADDLTTLKARAASTTGAAIWRVMKSWLDNNLSGNLSTYACDKETRIATKAAMAYLLIGETKYAQRAAQVINHFVNNITNWFGSGNGCNDDVVLNLSLAYDWIYNWPGNSGVLWGETQKAAFRSRVAAEIPKLIPASGKIEEMGHRGKAAKLLAGYTFSGEITAAPTWISEAKAEITKYTTNAGYGTDGWWSSGLSYATDIQIWSMGLALVAAKEHGDSFWNTDWAKNQRYFFPFVSVGATKTYDAFPYSDNYLAEFKALWGMQSSYINRCGNSALYFAYLFRDPVLQSFATQQLSKNILDAWIPTLLWVADPTIPSQNPAAALPLSHFFPDFSVIAAKSGWTENDTHFLMKTAIMGGAKGYANKIFTYFYDPHTTPDANSFFIFSRGDWLVTAETYGTPKLTRTKSTLLVDANSSYTANEGQYRENNLFMWRYASDSVNPLKAKIKNVAENGRLLYALGDASLNYKAGLNLFQRHVIFYRPDTFIFLDEISDTTPHRYDFNLQLEKGATISGDKKTITGPLGTAQLDVRFILPTSIATTTGTNPISRDPSVNNDAEGNLVYAPFISFHPSSNSNSTQFLAILEAKNAGTASSSLTTLSAVNGTAFSLKNSFFCLTSPLSGTAIASLGNISHLGKIVCWEGNQASATGFTSGLTKSLALPPYAISASAPIAISLQSQTGEISLESAAQISLTYPNLESIQINGSTVSATSPTPDTLRFDLTAGRYSLQLNTSGGPTTPSSPPNCDPNSDSQLTSADTLPLLRQWSQNSPNSDCHQDQKINALDLLSLLNLL